MIKIDNYEVMGWEHAIRGMRNPLNSWSKSDSFKHICKTDNCEKCCQTVECCRAEKTQGLLIGDNDLELMRKLVEAGPDHSKFMRMITVYVTITAPLYFYKEWDTYKVGTVANSCSTMHSIHKKEFSIEDFSCEHLINQYHNKDNDLNIIWKTSLKNTIWYLNTARNAYLKTKDKIYWWQMIQLLPSSYNQKRTIQLNYAVLRNMYHSRKNHKLDEWRDFCRWIETLPHSELITSKKDGE